MNFIFFTIRDLYTETMLYAFAKNRICTIIRNNIILSKEVFVLFKIFFVTLFKVTSFFFLKKNGKRNNVSMYLYSVILTSVTELFFIITYVSQTPVSSLGIQNNSQPLEPAVLLVNTSVGEGVPWRYIILRIGIYLQHA